MASERSFPVWPISSTLVGAALELGQYENRWLANVAWAVCGLVWLVWLATRIEWTYVSPEEREQTHQLSVYRRLGELIADGDTLLVELHIRQFQRIDRPRSLCNRWAEECNKYLRNEYSQSSAQQFTLIHLARANAGYTPELIEQLIERLKCLRELKQSVHDKLLPQAPN